MIQKTAEILISYPLATILSGLLIMATIMGVVKGTIDCRQIVRGGELPDVVLRKKDK